MDYNKILKKSWQIVKSNKILWILGMLLGGGLGSGSGGGGGSGSGDGGSNTGVNSGSIVDNSFYNNFVSFLEKAFEVVKNVPIYVWISLGVIFLLMIIFSIIVSVVVRNWAEGAVIGLVDKEEAGEKMTFQSAGRLGMKSLKDLIWISIVPSLIFFLIVAVITIIIVLLALIPKIGIVLAALMGIPLVLVVIFGSLVMGMIRVLANRVAVIEGENYWESYRQAFVLVKKSFFQMVGLGIINYLIGCGLSCLYLLVVIILILIVVIGFLIHWGVGVPLLLPALVFFVFSLLFIGAFNSFRSTSWTLFYKELKAQQEGQDGK